MKGANEMRDTDFEVQEIRIDDPETKREEGFGAVVCEYLYEAE